MFENPIREGDFVWVFWEDSYGNVTKVWDDTFVCVELENGDVIDWCHGGDVDIIEAN